MIPINPIQYVDLAIKTEKDPGVKLNPDGTVKADWFVIATGCRVQQQILLLDIFRAQIGFPEQVRAIKQQHLRWKSSKIGIEDVAYQWAIGQQLWESGFPAIPVKSVGDKVFRATLVTPHWETGRVRMRGVKEGDVFLPHPSMKRFVKEAEDFPFGDYDDVLDAVVGLVQMLTDEELMASTQLVVHHQPGMAVASTTRGGASRGDPYDVFKSPY